MLTVTRIETLLEESYNERMCALVCRQCCHAQC